MQIQFKKNHLLKIYYKFLFLFSFFLLIPFLFILLTPYKNKIKFIKIRRDVIGNAVEELYLYLNIYKKNKFHYFFFDDFYVCNEYFNQICKKNLKFLNFGRLIFFLSKKIKLFNKFIIEMPRWYALNNFKPNKFVKQKEFNFSSEQNKIGVNFFDKIGVKKNNKIVCLIVRDDFYKKNFSNSKNKNWNYHSYRNADIKSYLKTIKYLNKKGYFVIRMGKGAYNSLKYKNSFYFDYARSNLRNDFLDFWIIANSYFCITTGTGVDELCAIYHIPTVDTNFLPVGHVRSAQNYNLTIFKKIKNRKNNKFVSLSESIENELFYKPQILYKKRKDFFWLDNTPNEILQATKEMEHSLFNKKRSTKTDQLNQKEFWKKFKMIENYKKLYSKNELKNVDNTYKYRKFFNSSISNYFLKNNSWILK